MTIPEFSVNRPVTTLMSFFVVLVVGGVCLWQIPIDLFPEMDLPTISVITRYEGAAPVDVENKVTDVLEQVLATIPELKHITSKSKEGISQITLNFEWGTDLDTRANEIRDAVGMAKRQLPEDIDEPRVMKFDVSRWPILVYGATARESYPILEDILEDRVGDSLKQLPGVASVMVIAPLHRQLNVAVDREQLASYGLTLPDLARAIVRENKDTPAGNVKMGITDYLVRVPGEFRDVEPMRQIVLASRNGSVVRLSDVATVEDGFDEIDRYVNINGESGAILLVQKESEANTVAVARAVRKRIEEIKHRLPNDVQMINIMDNAEDIERLVSDLSGTLLLGGVLTMATVLFFLRRWRPALIIGLTMPFSIIGAVVLMFFLGYTINMMTLFGMIIAIGMIVDNAIVVVESVTRQREEGVRPREGAIYGASEVGMAITASTLTTVCIFFPILFVKGITKIFFTQFAVIVCITLLASLFSALTLVPMLAAQMMKAAEFTQQRRSRLFMLSERLFEGLKNLYGMSLDWALEHRALVVIVAVAFFAAALALVPYLGTEFMPEEDRGLVMGTVYLPVGTRIEETARVMKKIYQILMEEIPESERVAIFTRCGVSGQGAMMGDEGNHLGTFGVKLIPKSKRSRDVREIGAALRGRMDAVIGPLRIEKYQIETGDPMSSLILGGERPLTVNVIGDDMEVTDAIAAQIKEIALKTPGTVDVSVSREKGRPELWLQVDRAKASSLGLNVADVGDVVRAAFYGREASKYRVRGEEYDVFIRFREDDRKDVRDVMAMPVRLPSGLAVRADNLSNAQMSFGAVEIERKDQGRVVRVGGSVYKRSLGDVSDDVESEIAKLDVPPGVEVMMGGQTEEQGEAFFWMGLSLVVGLILVYMVMASQFESLLDPFVVMFSVPFAITGSILAMLPGGHHINIVVLLGLLMLIGIVVNNAIVLVDYINTLRGRGLSLAEAVREGGKTRLRPVLMTALTTIFGLAPMAFGKGQGSEVWNPLGLTVMGGLLVSTLVTLIFVPTMYAIFEGKIKKEH